ncbi:FKBP-type peptidyl-prolyl cis-trans isomerase [Tsuneonella sp. HG222]
MAEVTRVPLQPIAKGSLAKLWLGLLLVLALAAGLAYWAMPAGVEVDTLTEGEGPTPSESDVVFVKYTGKLPDGTMFDQSQELPVPVKGILPEGMPMQLSGVIPGFKEALLRMQKGGKYSIRIPADKAYGANPPPGSPIPPNSDLIFEVEMVDFMAEADAQRRVQMIQQMMANGQGGPPAEGGQSPEGGQPAPGAPGAPPAQGPAGQ